MPKNETTRKGYTAEGADQERDLSAKGGPTTGLGIPDDKHGTASPYNADLQTQIAAKGQKRGRGRPKKQK